jgi:hypothetical protein
MRKAVLAVSLDERRGVLRRSLARVSRVMMATAVGMIAGPRPEDRGHRRAEVAELVLALVRMIVGRVRSVLVFGPEVVAGDVGEGQKLEPDHPQDERRSGRRPPARRVDHLLACSRHSPHITVRRPGRIGPGPAHGELDEQS